MMRMRKALKPPGFRVTKGAVANKNLLFLRLATSSLAIKMDLNSFNLATRSAKAAPRLKVEEITSSAN
jgi:hypothetical protein